MLREDSANHIVGRVAEGSSDNRIDGQSEGGGIVGILPGVDGTCPPENCVKLPGDEVAQIPIVEVESSMELSQAVMLAPMVLLEIFEPGRRTR